MKAIVNGPGRAITRAASALSIPISSMTMAIIGCPAVGGMASAYCCQAGLLPGAGGDGGDAKGSGGVAATDGMSGASSGAGFGGSAGMLSSLLATNAELGVGER